MTHRNLAAAATLVVSGALCAGGCRSDPAVSDVPPPTLSRPFVTPPPPPPTHNAAPAAAARAARTSAQAAPPRPAPRPAQAAPPASRYLPNGLPRSVIPAVRPHAWQYIVLHHSDTPTGSAAVFDRYHREVKRWNSLGYHFVIGNGTNSGDGQVEPGPRWVRQETGAHAGVAKYNEDGIGICLVGDFERSRPSPGQIQATARLVAYLMRTYRIPASRVIGHRDTGRHTNCPGRFFNTAQVKQMAARMAMVPLADVPTLADGSPYPHLVPTGPILALDLPAPDTELLRDVPAQ